MSCPICGKRKAKRYCPAKGEKICAICCGTEREVTIDCPPDCVYLISSRRWDAEHREPISPDELPFPDVRLTNDFIHERQQVVIGLGLTVLQFAGGEPALRDADALEALDALAKTYRTLTSGILYEQPPAGGPARELYARLVQFLEDFKKQEAERGSISTLKDSEVFPLLVFLFRIGRTQTNGRPRSRAFLDSLRTEFPRETLSKLEGEGPRIITP